MRKWWCLLFFLPALFHGAGISYSVDFEGLDDSKTLRAVRSSSQLVALKRKPPSSINALRFRAESDIPEIVRVLKAHGYLEAEVSAAIENEYPNYLVLIRINPGPLYRIDHFRIILESPNDEKVTCERLNLKNIGITLGDPADTRNILESELCAMHILSQCGYPLAHIRDREIIADGKTKQVTVKLVIESGPFSRFGPTRIEGNTTVKDLLIEQQILWCMGDPYDSHLVEGTQEALMETGLFSSVFVTHDESIADGNMLPITIDVSEARHRSVSLGASFQTTYGAGATFGWENRNVHGMGRKILIQLDIAQRGHSGIASYLIPNYHCMGQNYLFQAQASYESINPYRMQSYSIFSRYDHQLDCNLFLSAGPKFEYLMVSSSVDNGNFFLVEAPLYLRWTNVQDVLNPCAGIRFEYRGTPAINVRDASDFYYAQVLTLSSYIPLWNTDLLVLAQKFTLGTIFSNGLDAVPVPKRFFGGSEDNLRGYKYYTVSPLEDDDKPIGGRSAVYYTVEPRFRVSESFGLVPFFDIGNVYLDQIPNFTGKWRKSAGIGVRYFSFLGPLRLDVAFPLNRRSGIDPHWWVFASIGQTF